MTMVELISVLKRIPPTASEFAMYPTNSNTLFFSLASGAIPNKSQGWGSAKDSQPGEGLARFKVMVLVEAPSIPKEIEGDQHG